MKSIVLTVLGLFVILAALAGAKVLQIMTIIDSGDSMSPPPIAVSTEKIKSDEWQSVLSTIGSAEAAEGLLLTADLSGRISSINFAAGDQVKAGDLLVQQDVSVEQAQLRSAQASAALTRTNLARIKALFGKKVASKSELDNAQSNYQSAVANVDNIRATIAKKSIRAPFDGSLGIRLVNLGQTINAGAALVSLQASNQMFVNFSFPQQQLSKLKSGLPVKVRSDAVPDQIFKGTINAIDSEIDAQTRSIKGQAILANPEGKLLTGMFVNIDVVLPDLRTVLLAPVTAIQYATFGDSVFLIEPQQKQKDTEAEVSNGNPVDTSDDGEKQAEPVLLARQQFVQLGEHRGDYVVVTKGLSEGDIVASAGGFKLRSGNPVTVNNSVKLDYSTDPTVINR